VQHLMGRPPTGTYGAWDRLGRTIERDAATDGVTAAWAWLMFWVPAVGGLLVAALLVHRRIYFWLLREDHPIEWIQFGECVFTCGVAALVAVHFARRRQLLWAAVMGVFALGAFGLAGEEISWGQRVLGLSHFVGGGRRVADNRQGEFNLHNIASWHGIKIEDIFRIAETGIALVGTVLPLLTRLQRPRLHGRFWRFISPPLFTVPCFLIMLGYRLGRDVVSDRRPSIVRYQEWAEFCLYTGLVLTALLIYAPLVRRASVGGPRHRAAADTETPTLHLGELRGAVFFAVFATVLTVVLAILTSLSGILPGNI
jgi:hypothetical protein